MSITEILYTLLLGPLQLVPEAVYAMVSKVIHNPGWSVVVLSLAMNCLLLLLYNRVDAIRKASCEGKRRFSIKGSGILLLELPFFFAASYFLSNVSAFSGAAFGVLKDLSATDGLLALGTVKINLLPVLMTLLGLLSVTLYLKGASLADKLLQYVLTVLIGVALYSAPAAVVLYWTMTNLFLILRTLICKLESCRMLLNVLLCLVGVALMIWGYYVADMVQLKRGLLMVVAGGACMLPAILSTEAVSKRIRGTLAEAKPNWFRFLLGTGLMTVLVGLLVPSGVLAASPKTYIDMAYFHDPIWYLVSTACLACGGFLLWMNVIYGLAGKTGKVLLEWLSWAAGAAMVVCYFCFGTKLGSLSGALRYSEVMYFHVGPQLFNLLVVAAVALIMYIVARKCSWLGSVALLAAVLVLGGLGAANTLKLHREVALLAPVAEQEEPPFHLSTKGRNVIILTLDRAASEYIPYIFNEKPELKEQFDGFTFYANTLAFSPDTRASISSLYGGYEYTPVEMNRRDQELLVDKHNEALKVLPVLFLEEGFDVTVCNPVFTNYRWEPDLSVYADYPQINAVTEKVMYRNMAAKRQLVRSNHRNLFCYSLMETMPLAIRTVLYDNGSYNRIASLQDDTGAQTYVDLSHARGNSWRFESNYEILSNLSHMTRITETAGDTYMYMNNELTMAPTLLQTPDYVPASRVDNAAYDEAHADRFRLDGEAIQVTNKEQITHYHVNMAAMLQLGKWFDYLRENGAYDNTRIILVSDHSWCLFSKEELVQGGKTKAMDLELYNPLLMVKDFDARGFSTSEEFMTIADVPTLALADLVAEPTNPFTGNPINSDEKTAHDQFVYMTWDDVDSYGTAFVAGRWGSVHTDLRNPENWTLYEEPMLLTEHKAP